MLSRSLKKVSVLALSGVLLGSLFSSNSWGMEAPENTELPVELRAYVGRYLVRPLRSDNRVLVPDVPAMRNLRLVSKAWKEGMDKACEQEIFIRIELSPSNYGCESLGRIAHLVSSVALVKWDETTSSYIGQALLNFPNVKRLRLDSNLDGSVESNHMSKHIGIKGLKSLARALEKYPELSTLTFVNSIGEEGGQVFGSVLPFLPHVRYLEVAGVMGPIGTKYFVEGLVNHAHLRTLNLGTNNIGDIGAVALADKFPNLPQLAKLHIDAGHKMLEGGKSGVVRDAGKDYLKRKAEEYLPSLNCSLLP